VLNNAYSQQLCFEPEPGACCYGGGQCADRDVLGDNSPMDLDTCTNPPYEGEFTNIGVTCSMLDDIGGCSALDDLRGACCWEGDCVDTNTFLCDYIGEYLPGGDSEFHLDVECVT
jgi:hypothetical protein